MVANHNNSRDAECDELAEFLDQTVDDYMSDGSPEACCKKLENMLSGNFEDSAFQELSGINFRLHPLHYLSLNAYIALSSACRVFSTNLLATDLGEESKFKVFKMRRTAAAYSLLLAGATQHLFMSEPSLIASAAVFWVNAGESIMGLLRSSCEAEFNLVFQQSQFTMEEVSYMSLDKCKETSIRFLECISKNLTKSWVYLVQGSHYLENISSPVDFSWLGITNICQILDDRRRPSGFCLCCEFKINIETRIEEYWNLARLAACCLTYGRYLAIICWGEQSYLVDDVGNLFQGIR